MVDQPHFNIRPPTRLERVEAITSSILDFLMAQYALLAEKGYIDPTEMAKMEPITKEARRKLGSTFTMAEGIQAIRATYRIEINKTSKGP